MMAIFSELQGITTEIEPVEITDGTSTTLMFAERYAADGGGTPAGTRLFVGNLTLDSSAYGPAVGDEVLVGFEFGQSKDAHPDFLWAPDWIL
jgi:hypothetical protein